MNNKQKNGKLPKWAIVLIVALSVVAILPTLLFAGIITYGVIDSVNESVNLTMSNTVEGYYNSKTNTYFINGYVKNDGKDDAHGIEIEYTLYDKNNNIIGTATAYIDELDEGRTWKFTAEYTGENAKDIDHFENKLFDYNYETWD